MSPDSEEIKTIEQWKWSEMQGLELVNDDSAATKPMETGDSVSKTEHSVSKTEEGPSSSQVEVLKEMENSEPVKNGSVSGGEKHEALPSVGFLELFRFADGLDCILMTIGTFGAIVHGCSLPLFLRFFADLVNSFGSNANNLDKMTQEVVKVEMIGNCSKFYAFVN